MTGPDLVVFDFDGTLCDSAGVKTDAFARLYDDHGDEISAAVLEHHLAHQGVSRFDKIRWVEETLLGRTPTDEEVERRADRFSLLVLEGVLAAPLFPGVMEWLEGADVPLALASATPDDELRHIAEQKGVAPHFVHIGGSPTPKGEIVAQAIGVVGAEPARTVMVGDQASDVEAARHAGCAFVGVVTSTAASLPPGVATIESFAELDDAIAAGLTEGALRG
jgi:phosphoglycolate phosphatase-like HAD superfamily hydrolase